MPAERRILLLSVSAGSGHVRAADALSAAATTHPTRIVATHLDVMSYVPRAFSWVYRDFYARLVSRHPSIWRYVYETTNHARPDGLMQRARRLVERLNTGALRKAIAAQ